MFESLSDRLQEVFDQLGRKGSLTEADVDTALREVRVALLEADVNLKITKDFIKRVRERAVGAEVSKALKPAQQVIKIVHEELIDTLGEPGRLNLAGATPRVIMLVGLQGSGKTTTGAKLALKMRKEGRKPFLVAADTYRPAAVDQLVTLAKQLSIPYHEEGVTAAPPDICVHGVQKAKEAGASVVILDTAGRLQIDENMMAELQAIKKRTEPAEVLLVADAMTGQEAVRIAEGFNHGVGITGLILTKIDGDARGGAAISMRAVTGVPIKYLGTGEKPDAFEDFHPDRLASRILGMGDMLTLIEKAEQLFDEQEARRMEKAMLKGQFTLEDFLKQLRQVKRLGSIGQIMEMIPGMGKLKSQFNIDDQQAEKNMKRIEAIIFSMTPEERRKPKVINANRKRRIAHGSGTSVQEVNQLLRQFQEMQNMMKKLGKGKMPNIPGMFK
ncbi:MAG: signal recognition particle protein [Anaerolineae bacterium]|nr:MAG: signal recognition particle protein [Anaerolineae bacterium]